MAKQFVYRVRPGFTHGPNREHQAGDEVIHTEAEARGFLDKLQLVGPFEEAVESTGDGALAESTEDGQTDPGPATKKRK